MYALLLIVSVIFSLYPSGKCCSLGNNTSLLPQYRHLSRGEIMVHPGKPATLACELICPGDLTGCNIAHHWIAMLKKDNYEVHYLSTTRTRRLSINGDYHVLDYNLSQLGNSLCASGESAVTFSINITHVNPEVEEVLIFCGLRRGQSRAAYSYNPVAAILKPDSPKIFSKQIQESPAVVVTEGDSVNITCERLVTNYTTQVQWMLTGSGLLPNDTLLIASSETLLLKNNMTLEVILQDGDVYEYNDKHLKSFSIIISNMTSPLNGLTARCGEWWAEGNISQFYEHAAVMAVTPPPSEDKSVTAVIFSHQSRNLTTTEGEHVTITCTRSSSTYAEWEFLFSDGSHYLYTKNKTMLENYMEFSFYNSESAPFGDRLQNFSVILTVSRGLNNMQIRCAAKETNESEPVFNSFTDVIIVEKAQGLFDGLSGKAVAAITTPTVAGTVIATIVVMILIIGAIIFLVNKNCQCRVKPRVGLSCSNQHVMSGYEQSYNNSVNERIARNLEMGAYTG